MTHFAAIGTIKSAQNGTDDFLLVEQLMGHVLDRVLAVLLAELAVLQLCHAESLRRQWWCRWRQDVLVIDSDVREFIPELCQRGNWLRRISGHLVERSVRR